MLPRRCVRSSLENPHTAAAELFLDTRARIEWKKIHGGGRIRCPRWLQAHAAESPAVPLLHAAPHEPTVGIRERIPPAKANSPSCSSYGFRRGPFQPDGCFIQSRRGAQEFPKESKISATRNRAWEPRPNQSVQSRQVVTGNFGKQVMFEVIIFVQQEKRDNGVRQNRPAGNVGICHVGDSVLREAPDSGKSPNNQQRKKPRHKSVETGTARKITL